MTALQSPNKNLGRELATKAHVRPGQQVWCCLSSTSIYSYILKKEIYS
jgi:hypothetical protein